MTLPVIASQTTPAFRIALNAAFATTYADLQAYADLLKRFHGQCRFQYSNAANCVLIRYNGKYISINGTHVEIPASGVTLSSTGTSNTTLYYAYAYLNSGTLTLECSTTAYVTDATTGVMVKSGDSSRTLVGMFYTKTANTFSTNLVASWFNRNSVWVGSNTTADRSVTTTGGYSEFHSEVRVEFMCWNGDNPIISMCGSVFNAASSYYSTISVSIDSTSSANSSIFASNKSTAAVPLGASFRQSLAEGYHYATIIGGLDSAGTVTLRGYAQLNVSTNR